MITVALLQILFMNLEEITPILFWIEQLCNRNEKITVPIYILCFSSTSATTAIQRERTLPTSNKQNIKVNHDYAQVAALTVHNILPKKNLNVNDM